MVCEQCGSIRITMKRTRLLDRVAALLFLGRPVICLRCGWRARRNWTEKDLPGSQYGAGGVELDPALEILDAGPNQAREGKAKTIPEPVIDLGQLDLAGTAGDQPPPDGGAGVTEPGRRSRKLRKRFRRSRRREILGTIAASALALFVVLIFGLAGSCGMTG